MSIHNNIAMEVFTTTYTSVECRCGGRHNNIPNIITKHKNTKKHITWAFNRLVEEFLSLTSQQDKVASLKKQRRLYSTGKVL
jgi:hypothetical protein